MRGFNILNQITEGVNFNSESEVFTFLNDILDHLEQDNRNEDQVERRLSDQLKQGIEVKDFYDFIFSLDYLTPNYKLQLGTKNISELSPGERGCFTIDFLLVAG